MDTLPTLLKCSIRSVRAFLGRPHRSPGFVQLVFLSILQVAFASTTRTTFSDELILSGTTVDEEGQPVSNVDVGFYWDFLFDQLIPYDWAFSEENGAFVARASHFRDEGVVCAFSDDRKSGCALWLKKSDFEKSATLKLTSLMNVRFNVTCPKLETIVDRGLIELELVNPDTPPWPAEPTLDSLQTWYKALPEGTVPTRSFGTPSFRNHDLTVPLPSGRYLIRVSAIHMEDEYVPLVIDETQGKDIVVNVEMSLSPLAELLGKPAPQWNITDSRGIDKDALPVDFRGKWLLVEFWGFWCGPCVAHSLPQLIDFHEQNPELADKLQIVAVHHKGAESIADLEQKLVEIKKTRWKNRDLPFPIIVDATTKTVDAFGVSAFPTAVLIDPLGNVTNFNGVGELKDLVTGRVTRETKPIEELYAPQGTDSDPDSRRAVNHVKIRPTHRITDHTEAATELQVDAKSHRIFSSGRDMTLIACDAQLGQTTHTTKLHDTITFSSDSPQLLFDSKRNRIVTTRRTGDMRTFDGPDAIEVRDAETMELVPSVIPTLHAGAKIALVDDFLFTVSWDAKTKQSVFLVIRFETGEVTRTWNSPYRISACEVSPGGKLVVCGGAVEGRPKALFAMDFLTGQQVWLAEYAEREFHGVRDIAFSPDGKSLVACNWNSTILIRDTATGEITQNLDLSNHAATAAAFSPDGTLLVTTGSNISPAVVWDLKTGQRAAALIGHRFGRIYRTRFLTNSRLVTVGGETPGEVCIWDLPWR